MSRRKNVQVRGLVFKETQPFVGLKAIGHVAVLYSGDQKERRGKRDEEQDQTWFSMI